MRYKQIFSNICRITSIKTDDSTSGAVFLLRSWQLLLLSSMLQIIESIHDFSIADDSHSIQLFNSVNGIILASYLIVLFLSFVKSSFFVAAPLVAIALTLIRHMNSFPFGANHFHLNNLLLYVSSMGLIIGHRNKLKNDYESFHDLIFWDAIYFTRWTVIYLMLWTGLNKLIYGTYFYGQFLAMTLKNQPRFQQFYGILLSQDELRILTNTEYGPFRFNSFLLIFISNMIYISEIVTGILLLLPKYRKFGAIMTITILIGIELVARELVFGSLMFHITLTFFPSTFLNRGFFMSAFMYILVGVYFLLRITNQIPDLGIT